jgi:hypothetical protein
MARFFIILLGEIGPLTGNQSATVSYIILSNPSDKLQEADMNETPTPLPQKADHVVAITAIIATTVILLTCIAGCSGVLITWVVNFH